MEIKALLVEEGFLPKKATEGAAAFDCFAREISFNRGLGYLSIKLGFKIEIPSGFVGKLYARSSVTNRGMFLGNSVGIIDSDFRGELEARFYPSASAMIGMNPSIGPAGIVAYCENVYRRGEACAQLIIEKSEDIEILEANELDTTVRNEGGFGSTDKSSYN